MPRCLLETFRACLESGVSASGRSVTGVPTPSQPLSARRLHTLDALSVAVAVVGGILVAFAPLLGVVAGSDAPGAVLSAALVAGLIAVAIPAVAATAYAVGRPELSGGLLAGAGAVSFGLVVLDIALVQDPINANRFELLRPVSAASLDSGVGAFVVLFGHLLGVFAGVLGGLVVHRAALDDAYGAAPHPELEGSPVAARAGFAWSATVTCAVVALAFSLFPAAWTSTDPLIVPLPALDSNQLILIATLLIAAALFVVVASALASASPAVAAGSVVGAAACALGPVAARLLAGIQDDRLAPTRATVTATVGAVSLLAAGAVLGVVVRIRDDRAATERSDRLRARVDEWAGSFTVTRWHIFAGAAGIAAALLIGIGALLPIVSVPAGSADPEIFATRVALVGAVALVVSAVWLLLSEFAAAVRPAFGVLCVATVMASSGVLQATVGGHQIDGVGVGPGSIAVALGVVVAIGAGVLAWCAGSAERDELDRSREIEPNMRILTVGLTGAVLSIIALGLPLYRGTDASAASFGRSWGWDTWGQAIFGVAVVVAVVLAASSRPARGSALVVGAAVGMLIYLASWPLTRDRVHEPTMGLAVPVTVVALVFLAATAVLAYRAAPATSAKPTRKSN